MFEILRGISLNKCLNCGEQIRDGFDVCTQKCAEEYYKYVFEEKLSDNPDFDSKIDPKGAIITKGRPKIKY